MFKTIVMGNLAADPERVKIGEHDAVRLRIGASVGYGDKKQTIWCGTVLFGKPGEAMMNYAHKGDTVHVMGDLNVREYDGKDGKRHTSIDIQGASVEIVKRASGSSAPQASEAPAQKAPSKSKPAPAASAVDLDDDDDGNDLPF